MPNTLTYWAIRAGHLLSHVFEYWLWQCRYFWSKVNIWKVCCARATVKLHDKICLDTCMHTITPNVWYGLCLRWKYFRRRKNCGNVGQNSHTAYSTYIYDIVYNIIMIYITWMIPKTDGWVQGCNNSSAIALELLQSCTKPSKHFCIWKMDTVCHEYPRSISSCRIPWLVHRVRPPSHRIDITRVTIDRNVCALFWCALSGPRDWTLRDWSSVCRTKVYTAFVDFSKFFDKTNKNSYYTSYLDTTSLIYNIINKFV